MSRSPGTKLDGRPLAVAKELAALTESLWYGFPSRRAWGRVVSPLVEELASFKLDPNSFKRHLDDWVVAAIERQRTLTFLARSGLDA